MGKLEETVIAGSLNVVKHPKGDILKFVAEADDHYAGFGEAYFSKIHFGEIKGWKRHSDMTLNLTVPKGVVKFVFFDEAVGEYSSYILSDENLIRLTVKPAVWFAFQGVGEGFNTVVNVASISHTPSEVAQKPLHLINYAW